MLCFLLFCFSKPYIYWFYDKFLENGNKQSVVIINELPKIAIIPNVTSNFPCTLLENRSQSLLFFFPFCQSQYIVYKFDRRWVTMLWLEGQGSQPLTFNFTSPDLITRLIVPRQVLVDTMSFYSKTEYAGILEDGFFNFAVIQID